MSIWCVVLQWAIIEHVQKSNSSVLVKAVTNMVTGCLKIMKVDIFALSDLQFISVSYEKYETLSIYNECESMNELIR